MTERPLYNLWVPAAEASEKKNTTKKPPATKNLTSKCHKSPNAAERESRGFMTLYENLCTGTVDLWIFIMSVLLGHKESTQQDEAVHTTSSIEIP